jgi:membrane protease YdiL (CAAX protease family)
MSRSDHWESEAPTEPDKQLSERLDRKFKLSNRNPNTARLWPVFVVFFLAMGFQFAWSWLFSVWMDGRQPHPFVHVLASMPLQLFNALIAIAGARLLALRVTASLGLGRPAAPAWLLLPIVFATLLFIAAGHTASWFLSLVIAPEPKDVYVFQVLAEKFPVLATILVALVPGFCEEIFFRGFIQRQLLQR